MDLRKIRMKTGYSQMRLAKLAGVSRFRMHLSENGYIKLSQSEKQRLLNVLKKQEGESNV